MARDVGTDGRARLERMALAVALDADAQLGADAPLQVAELRAAARELRRQTLALAVELGGEDRVIRFARACLTASTASSRRSP
jgi:hypothetical protein